jgi:hypothetical protein
MSPKALEQFGPGQSGSNAELGGPQYGLNLTIGGPVTPKILSKGVLSQSSSPKAHP